ncbi:Os04g0207501 [Oryza sativa Japonica Group]|uniref:Os04g0207501 protein n=1 Tax=Oryza sativa subsp. japonica TaxID=39947 RepID=A0A0P0W7M5_ORYSJ|nr:hypothetical protein EE612_022505 [Oryza sativa]BAS88114.1 Os04g0207501 [Oryza sativa Japonica Group]
MKAPWQAHTCPSCRKCLSPFSGSHSHPMLCPRSSSATNIVCHHRPCHSQWLQSHGLSQCRMSRSSRHQSRTGMSCRLHPRQQKQVGLPRPS